MYNIDIVDYYIVALDCLYIYFDNYYYYIDVNLIHDCFDMVDDII